MKRLLAQLLCVVMLLGYSPMNALALDDTTSTTSGGISLFAAPTVGTKVSIGDYEYSYNQEWTGSAWIDNKTLNGYGVRVKDLTKTKPGAIESIINDYPVVSMKYAYRSSSMTTAPDIPSTIKTLESAYSNTSLVTPPVIPEGVTNLKQAFANCSKLQSMPNIPSTAKNVTQMMGWTKLIKDVPQYDLSAMSASQYLGMLDFSQSSPNTHDLDSLYIPFGPVDMTQLFPSSSTSITRSGVLYHTADAGSKYGTNVYGKEVYIKYKEGTSPSTVKGSFTNGTWTTKVEIDEGFTEISGFSGNALLTSINIPSTVTNIIASAFSGCSSLEELILPDKLETIGASAFSGMSKLKELTLPSTLKSIGDDTFKNCTSLAGLTIPKSVQTIGTNAFTGMNAPIYVYANSAAEAYAKANSIPYLLAEVIPATGLLVTPMTVPTLFKGDTLKFTATVLPANATDKQVVWDSSNTAVGTVSSSGLFTALAQGDTVITAISVGSGKQISIPVHVEDTKIPVTGISAKDSIKLEVNDSTNLNAKIVPAWASVTGIRYTSDNTGIAYVKANGEVFGVAEGTATIKVESVDNPLIFKTVNVEIKGVMDNSPADFQEPTFDTKQTNNAVVIALNISGAIDYIELPNGTKFFGKLPEYTVYENGTYTFTVHGKDGSVTSKAVTVSNIDRELPTLQFKYGEDLMSVDVKAIDNVGISKLEFPNDTYNTTNDVQTYTIKSPADYGTVLAYDTAGNIASKDIYIKTVGGSGGSITYYALEGIPEDWTNKDVTLKAAAYNADDKASAIYINEKPKGRMAALFHTATIGKNGTYNLTVEGTDGSKNTDDFEVTKIDKVAPSIVATYKDNKVTYTVTDDLSGIKAIELPTGQVVEFDTDRVLASDNTFDFSGSDTLKLIAHDYAGNKTELLVNKDNSGSTPPPDSGDGGGGTGGGGAGGGGGGTTTPPEPIKPPEVEIPESNIPAGGIDKDGNPLFLKDSLDVNKEQLKQGYVRGYEDSTVKATQSVTRSEFAAMADRILLLPKEATSSFTDVKGKWYEQSVNRLTTYEIFIGRDATTFDPEAAITREETAIVLSRIVDLSSYSADCKLTDIETSYAKEEIAKLYNAGILDGNEVAKFNPKDKITRAETIKMLNRIFLQDAPLKTNIFKDLDETDWFYSDVLKSVQM